MENSIDILNELKELSTAVAAIEKVNVFTVPDGYFEYLAADIMLGIANENSLSTQSSAITATDTPAGYFDTLADSILI